MAVAASAVTITSVSNTARRSDCYVNFNIDTGYTAPTSTQINTLSSYLTSTSSDGYKQEMNAVSVWEV